MNYNNLYLYFLYCEVLNISIVDLIFAKTKMPKIDKSFYEGKAFLKPRSKANPKGVRNREIVTIQTVERTTLTSKDGKAKETYIEKFEEHEESFTLNKGNTKTQVELFGDNTDEWIGQKVKLIIVQAHNPNSGGDVPAIRIKAKDWTYGDEEEE